MQLCINVWFFETNRFFQNLVSLQHIFDPTLIYIFDMLGMSNHVLKEINKEIFIHTKTTVTLFLDLRIFSRMNRSQFSGKE